MTMLVGGPVASLPLRRESDRVGVRDEARHATVRRVGLGAMAGVAVLAVALARARGAGHVQVHLSMVLLGALGASALWAPAMLALHVRAVRRGRERDRLVERLLAVSDVERRRIAAELHDGALQDLLGLRLQVEGLAACPAGAAGAFDPDTAAVARGMQGVVVRLRSLLQTMYPVDVPPEGWAAGFDDLSDALERRGVAVHVDVAAPRPSSVHELVALRVVREALRNVAAHAHARNVWVVATMDDGRLVVTVDDDGVGFDDELLEARHRAGHYGLRLLRDLACETGAALTVTSRAGSGTRIILEMQEEPSRARAHRR